MSEENGNPTGNGASTIERLENFLTAEEAPAKIEPAEPAEPEAAKEEGSEVEPQASDDGADVEGPQITTDDLSALLGVDASMFAADEDGNVVIKTKIDGKEGSAKLNDILAAYQLRGHVDNQSREVAEKKKALDAQAAEFQQRAVEKLQEVDDIASLAHQELMREFQAVNWQELRQYEPAEYAAKLADFQMRQGNLNAALQKVQLERQRIAEQNQTQEQALLAAEAAKMRAQIPGWSDDVVAAKEWAELEAHVQKDLAAWGEQPEGLNVVKKAFHINLLRKAMLYDKMMESKAGVEKKVRIAPKLVKPGQAASAQDGKTREFTNLRSIIKKSGGKQGIREFLIASGKV
jgi:hypothetical protein